MFESYFVILYHMIRTYTNYILHNYVRNVWIIFCNFVLYDSYI